MRALVLAALAAVSTLGAAAAQEVRGASRPHVVVCERDGMAERALKREHGAVVWTTSAEVLAAVRAGRGWAAPRCISKLEHWRMDDQLRRGRSAEMARAKARQVLAQR